MTLIVRQAQASDAQAFLLLLNTLDNETQFMLFEPRERKIGYVDEHIMAKLI